MSYDYSRLVFDCNSLVKKYKICEMFSIGESVMERKLYCLKTGTGKNKLFVNGAHHGTEHLTSFFLTKFFDDFCGCYLNKRNLLGYNISLLYNNVSLYCVPMVNPDGVDIAINGIDITNPYHRKLISAVGIHSFNKVWQANANGVDISNNYNADWKVVREHPSSSGYQGPYYESEPETKAIVNFVKSENFDMMIAFHSQDENIYYDFDGSISNISFNHVNESDNSTGSHAAIAEGTSVFKSCSDWFIKEFGKSGFTIEIGKDKNPLSDKAINDIYESNARIILNSMLKLTEK